MNYDFTNNAFNTFFFTLKLYKIKITLITLFVALFFASTGTTSCSSPSNTAEEAKENVMASEKKLEEAKEDYQHYIENYRMDTATKLTDNEKIINDVKIKIANDKKDVKELYHKKIDELEAKNKELKNKIDSY